MLSLSIGDSHTGLDFWLNEPVKNIHEWLSLMCEYYAEQEKAIKKAGRR